jgi:hypothetical protein
MVSEANRIGQNKIANDAVHSRSMRVHRILLPVKTEQIAIR